MTGPAQTCSMNHVEKIRQKLASGLLPTYEASTLFAGNGTDRLCDGCDLPVRDIENEFDAVDGRVLRFHRSCYEVWNTERQQTTI